LAAIVGRREPVVGMTPSPARRSGVNDPLTRKRPKRHVENPAFGAMLRRMVRAYVRRGAADDPEVLADLARLREELDGHLTDLAAELRHRHLYSWRELAGALGTTRQAVQQRFRKAAGGRQPGGQPGGLR
jgi:hypothetical protein